MPEPIQPKKDGLSTRSLQSRVDAPERLDYPGGHLGLAWTAISADDIASIEELLSTYAVTWMGSFLLDKEFVALWIDQTVSDPNAHQSIVGRDREGNIQAIGSVFLNRAAVSEIQAELLALVRPEWRQKGVGRALLEWQDGRARQMISTLDQDLPVSLRTLVRQDDLERRRLMAAGGFSQTSRLFKLVKQLRSSDSHTAQDAQSRLAKAGLTVRPYTDSVREAVFRLSNRLALTIPHREPVNEQFWRFVTQGSGNNGSIVLSHADEIVGYAFAQMGENQISALVGQFGVERALRSTTTERDMLMTLMGRFMASGHSEMTVCVQEGQPTADYLMAEGFLEGAVSILYSIDL